MIPALPSRGAVVADAPPAIRLRRAELADVPALTALFAEMRFSRLHGLGDGFVQLLHRHIILSRHAVCIVADDGRGIVGYIAGATDGSRFARSFVLRHGVKASALLLPRIFNRLRLLTVSRCLTYFSENATKHQAASGLAFAVRHDATRRGIGRALWHGLMDEFRKCHIDSFTFLTAGEPSEPANAFYERIGCEFVGLESFYGDTKASVYRYRL
jgi:ribosomal protein S18 acetylase RimI-like enzyme